MVFYIKFKQSTESAYLVFAYFFEVAVSVDEMPSFLDKG